MVSFRYLELANIRASLRTKYQNRKLFSENECFFPTFRSLLVPVNPKDVKSFAYQCTTSQYGDYDCVRHWDYQSRQGKRFNGAVAKPETDENSA